MAYRIRCIIYNYNNTGKNRAVETHDPQIYRAMKDLCPRELARVMETGNSEKVQDLGITIINVEEMQE